MSLYWKRAQIIRCENCSLLKRQRLLTPEEIQKLYSTSWESPGENRSETGGTDNWLAERYAQCLMETLGLQSLQGLRLLELGAGRGATMKALSAVGAEVYGVEPFGYSLLKKEGFNAFRDLSELPEGMKFDGVYSIDVVEHLAEPWSTVQQLKNLLNPHGWMFVATPNAAGLNAGLRRSNWKELKRRGHLVFFRPDSLEFLLRKCDFTKYRRLNWQVDHETKRRRPIGLLHRLLGALKLGGELRYLAFPS
jgi:SAM-dependent methyltransferase